MTNPKIYGSRSNKRGFYDRKLRIKIFIAGERKFENIIFLNNKDMGVENCVVATIHDVM